MRHLTNSVHLPYHQVMTESLTKGEIESALQKLSGWDFDANHISRTFIFDSFKQAIAFIVEIGHLSEAANHHPEIYNLYNQVVISLTTHDAGDTVTHKDIDLAQKIEAASTRVS